MAKYQVKCNFTKSDKVIGF